MHCVEEIIFDLISQENNITLHNHSSLSSLLKTRWTDDYEYPLIFREIHFIILHA